MSTSFSVLWKLPLATVASRPARNPVPTGSEPPNATMGAMDCFTVIGLVMKSCSSLLAPTAPTRTK